MSTGTILIVAGIAVSVISLILLIVILATASASRRKMIDKI